MLVIPNRVFQTKVYGGSLRLHLLHCLEKVFFGMCDGRIEGLNFPDEGVVVLDVVTVGIWKFRVDLEW